MHTILDDRLATGLILDTADRCIEVNLELEELQRRLIPFSLAHYQDDAVEVKDVF